MQSWGSTPSATRRPFIRLTPSWLRNIIRTLAATGNAEMFEAVNAAYDTLSDPDLRFVFDRVKGVGQDDGGPKFSGAGFFDALGREAILRSAILCVLYDRRLTKPTAPSLSMRHLEVILEAKPVEISSALWYLKQRGFAASDDKSSLQITVDGMDLLETSKPKAEDVMAFIKPSAIAGAPAPPPQIKKEAETVMATLNRALSRTQG